MKNSGKQVNDPFESLRNEVEKQMEKLYSKKVIEFAKNPINMGRMSDPDGAAVIKGLCGDTMEIYLRIINHQILDINFYTEGCGVTLACGSAVTIMAKNKDIYDVLNISPQRIIKALDGLPNDGLHCAILSVNTLHQAVADYLLRMF